MSLPLPVLPQMTPMTPNFTVPQVAAGSIPTDCLSKWAETVSMMLSPSINSDTSSALLAFGDHLLANQWVEAAHVWYVEGFDGRGYFDVAFQLPAFLTDGSW